MSTAIVVTGPDYGLAVHMIVGQQYASNPCHQAWTMQGALELPSAVLALLPAPVLCQGSVKCRMSAIPPLANLQSLVPNWHVPRSTSFSGTADSLRLVVVVLQLHNLVVYDNSITGTLPSSWSNFPQASNISYCVQAHART